MIELRNLGKIYKSKKSVDTEALKNINIKFDNKGMTFVLGKSGCGKSTLLNILGGLDTPTSGEVLYNGKSFKDYKEKDYDSYRNEIVGFVFQEYNLIDKFNVFENVAYPLKLQNKKIDENKVIEALNKVGLGELKDRKVNELSGGQKQRVAIARALVKNPKIILADEPTGNLDSESAKGIFELLKSLSTEILVIVISHDEESARTYGDRIVFLQDGVITGVTSNNEVEPVQSESTSKRNKLPLKEIFGIAFKNFGKRKGKLILSVILISITISLFGLSIMQKYIKDKEETVRLLDKYEAKYITVNKLVKQPGVSGPLKGFYRNTHSALELTDEEFDKVKKEYNLDLKKAYYFSTSLGRIPFLKPLSLVEEEQNDTKYIDVFVSFNNALFKELDKDEFNFKLIGRAPTNYEEIVISKIYADYLIRNGTYLYEEEYENMVYDYTNARTNKYGDKERKTYKPTSYEEIINDDKYIAYGFGKVKIVGIVDEDLSEYKKLLESTYKQGALLTENVTKLEVNSFINIYVLKGFKDNFDLKIKESKHIDLREGYTDIDIILEEDLNNDYELKDNEIVVPYSYLDVKSKDEFSKKLNEYVIASMDKDPSFGSNYYKEEFIKDYIKSNEIINSHIKLVSYDGFGYYEQVTLYTIKDVKDIDNYIVSSEVFNKESKTRFITYIDTNNKNDYVDAINKMPIDGNEYVLNLGIIEMVAQDSFPLKVISVYILVISLFFSLFAVLQLFNYMNTTILDNKKEIGIFRSLGTSKKDISKMYLVQGIIVAIISYIISLSLCYLYSILENQMFFSNLKSFTAFDVRLIGLVWQSALMMFVFLLLLVIISSISSSRKIAKLKPVDAINDK